MKDGFISVAAATPKIRVADCEYNTSEIIALIKEANEKDVRILCMPELCVTAYTCGDLFYQTALISAAEHSLKRILAETTDIDVLCAIGLPVKRGMKLYNCAAVIHKGKLLGIVPKQFLPNCGEASELRWFSPGMTNAESFSFAGQNTLFGINLIFNCESLPGLNIGVELGEDLSAAVSPSVQLACAGASIILNPRSGFEVIGRAEYQRLLVSAQSAKLICGYVSASCGEGESSTDLVFGAQNIIAENGSVIEESSFSSGIVMTQIDIGRLDHDRMTNNIFFEDSSEDFEFIPFPMEVKDTKITRKIQSSPFISEDKSVRDAQSERILQISAIGLCKRIEHTNSKAAVIGLSGGLDSTLALLIIARAMKMLSRPMSDIVAVTMPCFGTTQRTRSNAVILAERIGVDLRTVNISESVRSHFRDIGQSEDDHDVTFENSQARERTQVLMDIANQVSGMVIGTGDLSELALGWATYNGDHMSMYGVNGSIPKTLVRCLVSYVSDSIRKDDAQLADVLDDILATPVSPELLPAVEGEISQKTENLVGPYELHDFYLYYILRWAFSPKKILRLAKCALGDVYDDETMLKWLRTFYRRFFTQQFKRSCLPDGAKASILSLSPRGDWHMPSDAVWAVWQKELDM